MGMFIGLLEDIVTQGPHTGYESRCTGWSLGWIILYAKILQHKFSVLPSILTLTQPKWRPTAPLSAIVSQLIEHLHPNDILGVCCVRIEMFVKVCELS